jgi:hypothetical protein
MQASTMTILSILLFLLFGELFYGILTHGKAPIRSNRILRLGLTVAGPVVLLAAGDFFAFTPSFFLKLIGLFAVQLLFPRAIVYKFVEKRHSALTADIPGYDTKNHPGRTVFVVLLVYWGVLSFFAYELGTP